MADNIQITAGSGTTILTDDCTTGHAQVFKLAISADGSATLVPADEANGIDVDVTRLPSLPAGTNMIGKVDLTDGTNDAVIDVSATDSESATTPALVTNARAKVFNGSTWDRQRGFAATNKTATYTSAQTGVALWTPAAGKALVITSVQIQSYGTTAGTAILWFGGAADTTYTRATDASVFDGEFAPSATNKPGVIMSFPTPVRGTVDFVLRVTTTNAQSITVNVWGYEI